MEKDTIILDLDDTLIAEVALADSAFQKTCRSAAVSTGIDPFRLQTEIRRTCRALWHNSPARAYAIKVGISSWEALWAEFTGENESLRILSRWASTYRQTSWVEALKKCSVHIGNVDNLARELGNRFMEERRKLNYVYEDSTVVLNYLQGRYKLGLLTNGCPDLQRRKLEGSGLESYFDTVVIAGEVNIGKPDKRVFELILNRLDTSPGAAVMVGNSLESDIAPAGELGMTAIWINREEKEPESPPVRPDMTCNTLLPLMDRF